ncbi:MAG TPA: hypothetical protein VGH33_07075, partial [Isosphaeraceae bacterium]
PRGSSKDDNRGDAMSPKLATDADLEAVRVVLDEFRSHWDASRPPFPCRFDGTPGDLDALSYLDYEIGYPPSGLWGAAIVWGCVLAANGPFRWHLDAAAGLVLRTVDDPSLLIWPYARVLEMQGSATASSRKYRWLVDRVVFDCLTSHLLGEPDERHLLALLTEGDPSDFLERCEFAAGRLRIHLDRDAHSGDRAKSSPEGPG